jgi:hypothetical protein
MLPRTELRTEIEIEAAPERVYSVLTDFARYHEWNPFITSISGTLRLGERLHVEMSLPEGRSFRVRPTVLRLAPNQELAWQGRLFLPGLFDGEHFFRLVARAPNITQLIHGENFRGLLLGMLNSTLTLTARGFVYMNQALKEQAERKSSRGARAP